MPRTETRVNGHEFKNWAHMDSTPARRFAAATERNHPAIRRIGNAPGGQVEVLLTMSHDESCHRLEAPGGWEVDHINVVESGATYVYYSEVGK